MPGRNHFDVLDEYLEPDSQTMRTILGQIRRVGASPA